MTKKQLAAAELLRKALDRCHKVGLMGGVYEYTLRVWPVGVEHPADRPANQFFDYIDEVGASLRSKMSLDGGSGV